MEKEVVRELIQSELTPKNLSESLKEILSGPEREKQIEAYQKLKEKLGGPGASRKTARFILEKM